VRIAPRHPGASPSMLVPDSVLETFEMLAKFAFGRASTPVLPDR